MSSDEKWGHGTLLETIKIEDPAQYERIQEKQAAWKGISAQEYYDQLYEKQEEEQKQKEYERWQQKNK